MTIMKKQKYQINKHVKGKWEFWLNKIMLMRTIFKITWKKID